MISCPSARVELCFPGMFNIVVRIRIAWIDFFFSVLPLTRPLCRWVGDQDPSFKGLQSALTNMMHSVLGCFRCKRLCVFERW
jgi:hypothetical protein